uniref:Uncharacterized protein n=1 Tax=Anguilla anguilla TaxID=7936 RepID=A0A0E9TPF3_ANGAN
MMLSKRYFYYKNMLQLSGFKIRNKYKI